MNYYFPYGTGYPFFNIPTTKNTGLLGKIFKNGINWSSILNGTQKTLGIINQTIPTIKQISPVIKNAKTMFKVMNEFKKIDTPNNESKENISYKNNEENKNNILPIENQGPTFFV